MEKQIENKESNNSKFRKGNFVFKKFGLSIGISLFSGILTYVIASALNKNARNCGEKNTQELSDVVIESKESIPVNNPDKIDSGSRVFKVRDSVRNNSERIYWRAKKRFITG